MRSTITCARCWPLLMSKVLCLVCCGPRGGCDSAEGRREQPVRPPSVWAKPWVATQPTERGVVPVRARFALAFGPIGQQVLDHPSTAIAKLKKWRSWTWPRRGPSGSQRSRSRLSTRATPWAVGRPSRPATNPHRNLLWSVSLQGTFGLARTGFGSS